MRRIDNNRGAVSVEAALLVPVLVLVMAVATAGWRVWWASTQVQAAAESAARAAAQTTDVARAQTVVTQVVEADLRTVDIHCSGSVVRDDLRAVALPAGVPGMVSVSVECTIGLADLIVPGLPGAITVRGDASEAIDVFRGRGR